MKNSSHITRDKTEKLAWRLSQIIARLHQSDVIDKHQLAKEFKVDKRTIERDLNSRLLGIAERDDTGRWQLTYQARSTVTEDTTEVLLRVSPEVAHYFVRRPLLPQQNERKDSDGSLLVTAQINHINQLLPLVRHWLPHVRIVEPKVWHAELVHGLQNALAQWGESGASASA